MKVRTGAGRQRGPRAATRTLAVVAAAAALVLSGCDDDGGSADEGAGTEAATAGPDDGGEGGEGGDGEAEEGEGGAAPPTEPADIPAVPGDRSATSDGSQVTVEGDRAAFVTPTGNIACVLNEETATCQITDKVYNPSSEHLVPDVTGDCSAEEADAMMLVDAAGSAWTCAPESFARSAGESQGGWWAEDVGGQTTDVDGADAAVLPYGQTLVVGPTSCTSSEAGVSCRSDALNGRTIELAQDRYEMSYS